MSEFESKIFQANTALPDPLDDTGVHEGNRHGPTMKGNSGMAITHSFQNPDLTFSDGQPHPNSAALGRDERGGTQRSNSVEQKP